jgi:acylglycerol lipase
MVVSTNVPCFTWATANTPPRAVLVCLHGFGLYGGTFAGLADRLRQLDVIVYAPDVRGFGSWQTDNGSRCRLDLKASIEDVHTLLLELHNKHEGLPIFILGESLGASIAAAVSVLAPGLVDGLILSAPARFTLQHKREIATVAFSELPTWGWGKPICISSGVAEHAPHIVAWRETDPLIRLDFTVTELLHLVAFLLETYMVLSKLPDMPILVVQGHGDQLITTHDTLEFFARIPSSDKELVVIGSAGHLIYQVQDLMPQAVTVVRHWLREHIQAALPAGSNRDLKRAS